MKIKIYTPSEEYLQENDYRDSFELIVDDGKARVMFCDGEPEDATLSRDFSGIWEIPNLMRLAYEAGKNGESFEVQEESFDKLD